MIIYFIVFQNSVCPTNTPYPYCSAPNTDISCPSASGLLTGHIIDSSSDCGRFPYDIQIPPNVHPSPAKYTYLLYWIVLIIINKLHIIEENILCTAITRCLMTLLLFLQYRLSYPYVAEDLSSPCQQTLQNFGYQLQVPVVHRRDSNYGSLSGIIDKTYKKCPPCPSKLVRLHENL